jgi:hypothetical protein
MTAKVRHPYATGIALSLSSEALTSLGISQLQDAQFLLRELGKSTFFSTKPLNSLLLERVQDMPINM